MKAEMDKNPSAQGVINGKAFFHLKIDVEAWVALFAMHEVTAFPDWWMIGEVAAPATIVTAADSTAPPPWLVVATTNPGWWVGEVERLAAKRGQA